MITVGLASFPGTEDGQEKAPGTHCLCMRLIAMKFRGDPCLYVYVCILVTS